MYSKGMKKIAAMCILQFENKFLLLKRSKLPFVGHYVPVGGKLEANESPDEAVKRETGSGFLWTIMNFIWFFVGGIWITLTHFLFGVFFYITIIGIPFGKQHFKLMNTSLSPFGRDIVAK